MGKALADPLFIVLVFAGTSLVTLYRQWLPSHQARRHSAHRHRSAHPGLAQLAFSGAILAYLALWLLGTHAFESALMDRLNRVHPVPSPAEIAAIDVVVVLSGGFVAAPVDGYEQPDAWSTARVLQGARTFLESDARQLVVTGYWSGADSTRLVRAMKGLAVQMGVPEDQVIIEPNARNTRAHPVELLKLDVIKPGDTVGVVTSSWHLPRAVGEFEKHFPRIVAVPAFDTAIHDKSGLLRWMPRSRSLASSATALAEYIGMLWYAFR